MRLAGHDVGGSAMSKAELARMIALEEKDALGTLKPKEADRLNVLRDKLAQQQAEELPCPFRTDSPHPTYQARRRLLNAHLPRGCRDH